MMIEDGHIFCSNADLTEVLICSGVRPYIKNNEWIAEITEEKLKELWAKLKPELRRLLAELAEFLP